MPRPTTDLNRPGMIGQKQQYMAVGADGAVSSSQTSLVQVPQQASSSPSEQAEPAGRALAVFGALAMHGFSVGLGQQSAAK